jgi:hypothetical protein
MFLEWFLNSSEGHVNPFIKLQNETYIGEYKTLFIIFFKFF